MTLNRRNFLRATLSGAAIATAGGSQMVFASSCSQAQPVSSGNVTLNLSLQEGLTPETTYNRSSILWKQMEL